jgi:hypothetical protein
MTISIMEEFLRSTDPQVRKNALTALSVTDDQAAAELMAKAALSDEDRGVRKRALEEVALLGGAARPYAVKLFAEALESEDELLQQRAYFVLGQLKSKGVPVSDVRVPRGRRMRLAASVVSRSFLARNWLHRLRGWRYGFWGSLAGVGVFIIYAADAFATRGLLEVVALIVAAAAVVCLGVLLAVFSTQFATSMNLHLSRRHAVFIELITSFVCSIVGLLLFYTFLGGYINSLFRVENEVIFFIFIPLCGLLAMSVRLGTIIGLRVGEAMGDWKAVRLKRLYEVFAGTLAGFFSMSVVFFIYWINASKNEYMTPEIRVVTSLWLSSLAIALGLANAYAKIDSEAPPE